MKLELHYSSAGDAYWLEPLAVEVPWPRAVAEVDTETLLRWEAAKEAWWAFQHEFRELYRSSLEAAVTRQKDLKVYAERAVL